jgi:hypothetical protein
MQPNTAPSRRDHTGNSGQDDEQGTCTCPMARSAMFGIPGTGFAPRTGGCGMANLHQCQAGYSIQGPTHLSEQTPPDQESMPFTAWPFGPVLRGWRSTGGQVSAAAARPGPNCMLGGGRGADLLCTQTDGTEVWNQINYFRWRRQQLFIPSPIERRPAVQPLPGAPGVVHASLHDADTLWMTIQPLTMELCDGQAQAMSR